MQAGTRVSGTDICQFIRVAEHLLGKVRPPKGRTDDAVMQKALTQLVHDGVNRHLAWERDKIDFCWKIMMQLRMKRIPPALVDYCVVLPDSQVEMHFLEARRS